MLPFSSKAVQILLSYPFFTSNRKNTDNDNHDESQKEDATAKNTQTLNLKP